MCPVSSLTGGRLRPSLIVWVGGPGTPAHERDQLVALDLPGVWIGVCAEGMEGWPHIEPGRFDDRNRFVRQFVVSVGALVEISCVDDAYDGVANPRRPGR